MARSQSPEVWDSIAERYDGLRPDQGLTDPQIRGAWTSLLLSVLPASPAAILDVGCGTGSLSLLLAESGYGVTGIDFSPGMIAAAKAKAAAAGADIRFVVGDAATPNFPAMSVDAIVCRQALWALPDRRSALRNWAALLRDGGRLVLVEGRFASGNGLSETEVVDAFPETLTEPAISDLSGDAGLWGAPLSDERLLFVAARQPRAGAQASR